MEFINLDFNRIISTKEILNIDEEKYKKINTYCNIINNEHKKRVNSKKIIVTFKLYKTYNSDFKKNINKYASSSNKNECVYYLMGNQNENIRDLTKKEREIIACNFLFTDNEMFLNILAMSIMLSDYKDINDLYTEINYLCELRDNDSKKFKFILPRLKLEKKLIPIIQTFIKYYNISDINIILNKLNEINSKKEKTKKLQMVKNENN